MQHVEMLSAALGMLGSLLLATKSRYAGLAFVAWFVSNIGWLIFGARNDHTYFFAQQIGFTVTSLLGIWNWLVHPALRDAEQEATHEPRASAIINQHLDRDFVGLVMGATSCTPRLRSATWPWSASTWRAWKTAVLWSESELEPSYERTYKETACLAPHAPSAHDARAGAGHGPAVGRRGSIRRQRPGRLGRSHGVHCE